MHESIESLVPLLGRALLHFFWQGALIAAVAAAVLQALRHARPHLRYAVACLALLACVLAPVATLAWGWLPTSAAAEAALAIAPAQTAVFAAPGGGLTAPLHQAGQVARGIEPFLPAVVLLWAAGACTLSLRLAAGVWWLGRVPRHLAPHLQRAWQARLDALTARFGLRRAVELRLVAALDSPVVVGWWRPVVLLPAALVARLPVDYLEALLAHELAHIRRHDYLVNLLQGVAEALLFYHPATWWLSRRIRVEREQVADHLAAGTTGQPRRLALALAALADEQAALRAAPQPALAALAPSGGSLVKRIEQLVHPGRAPRGGRLVFPLLGLAAAGLAFYAQANRDPSASPAGSHVFTTTASLATPAAPPPAGDARRSGQVAAIAQAAPAAASSRAAPVAVRSADPVAVPAPAAVPAPPAPGAAPAPPVPPAAASPSTMPAPPAPPRAADVAPAPPPPPPPTHVSVRQSGTGGDAYALVSKDGDGYLMSGSSDDMPQIEAMKRSLAGDFLWFRRDGKAYVVTDPATVAQVRSAWAHADALGERMRVLGEQMEGHGKKMEAIGREMERVSDATTPAGIEAASRQMESLGRRQGELGERQARLSLAMAGASQTQRADLERQMRTLEREQEALSQQMQVQSHKIEEQTQRHQRQLQPMEALSQRMEEASRPMDALGKQMDGLGKQMDAVSKRAEAQTRQQIDNALAKGLARPLPQRQ